MEIQLNIQLNKLFSNNNANRIGFLKLRIFQQYSVIYLIFEYILHPKIQLKYFMIVSPLIQTPPIAPICSAPVKHTTETLKLIFHPDVLIACRHYCWLLTLMIEKRSYFSVWRLNLDFLNLPSFWSYFTLFRIILWQENETKGKESLHTFYFKLQFIWASNISVLFNSSGWYFSGFLKYNTH